MISDMTASLCQFWSQLGLALLIQSSAVIGLGLGIGRILRPHGPFVQSLVYRTTLIALVLTVMLSVFARPIARPAVRVALPVTDAQRNITGNAPVPTITNGNPYVPLTSNNIAVNTVLKSVGSRRRVYSPIDFGACIYALLAGVWIIGVTTALGWMMLGQILLVVLRRKSTQLASGEAFEALQEICAARSLRSIGLVSAPRIRSPFLASIFKPTIFLPSGYEAQFDSEALRAILAHEAAHAERRDNAWMLLARLMRALLWFQPLLWLLCRNLEQSSEGVCDQLTITSGCSRRAYADCLLTLASQSFPSALERSLGAGMVPFRSLVGLRISQLFDASLSIAPPTTKMRLATIGGLLVAGIVIVECVSCSTPSPFEGLSVFTTEPISWPAPADYLAQFTFAARHGWTIAPVHVLSNAYQPVTNPVLMPLPIVGQEVNFIRKCKNQGIVFPFLGGVPWPLPPASRRQTLEQMLVRRPHFFYAEYLIGEWYMEHGDPARYQAWRERSLDDAPVVLAGQAQFADGKPVVGYNFVLEISYSPTTDFKEEASMNLDEPNVIEYPVTTDKNGCYYVPAWSGICQLDGGSNGAPLPGSFAARSEPVSLRKAYRMEMYFPEVPIAASTRFVCTTKVGLFSPIVLHPYLQVNPPLGEINLSEEHPLPVHGTHFVVSWEPVPSATHYQVSMTRVTPIPDGGYQHWDFQNREYGGYARHASSTRIDIALGEPAAGYERDGIYGIEITSFNAQRNQYPGPQQPSSRRYYFRSLDAPPPPPLTKDALRALFGEDVTIDSLSISGRYATVLGTMPKSMNEVKLMSTDVPGWPFLSFDENGYHPAHMRGQDSGRIPFRLVFYHKPF